MGDILKDLEKSMEDFMKDIDKEMDELFGKNGPLHFITSKGKKRKKHRNKASQGKRHKTEELNDENEPIK